MIQIEIGLFKGGRQPGINRVQHQRPLVQDRVLAQAQEQVKPVPAGGAGGDVKGITSAVEHELGHPVHEVLGAGPVVVDREARDHFLALAIHDTHSVDGAVDVNAHQKRVGHTHDLLIMVYVMSAAGRGNPWPWMRATASRTMRTPPAERMRSGSAAPDPGGLRTGCE